MLSAAETTTSSSSATGSYSAGIVDKWIVQAIGETVKAFHCCIFPGFSPLVRTPIPDNMME